MVCEAKGFATDFDFPRCAVSNDLNLVSTVGSIGRSMMNFAATLDPVTVPIATILSPIWMSEIVILPVPWIIALLASMVAVVEFSPPVVTVIVVALIAVTVPPSPLRVV